MMTYQDWIARGAAVCNAECAKAMGWKDGADFFGYPAWIDGDGKAVFFIEELESRGWSPTSDRNDCARMLKHVADEGRSVFFDLILAETIDDPLGFQLDVLLLDPSMLCWCAWRALKETE